MDSNEKDALQFCAVLACAGLCVVAGIAALIVPHFS